MDMHNGVGNGQGFIFADDDGLSNENGKTVLTSICKVPKGLEELNTKYFFSKRLELDDMLAVLAGPIYRGTVKLKQLAYLKVGYKGKNANGGRSCKMVTPAAYKNNPMPTCITWGTMPENTPCWVPESPRS